MQQEVLLSLLSTITTGEEGLGLFIKENVVYDETDPSVLEPIVYGSSVKGQKLLELLKRIVSHYCSVEYLDYLSSQDDKEIDRLESITPGYTDVNEEHILHSILVLKQLIEDLETPFY